MNAATAVLKEGRYCLSVLPNATVIRASLIVWPKRILQSPPLQILQCAPQLAHENNEELVLPRPRQYSLSWDAFFSTKELDCLDEGCPSGRAVAMQAQRLVIIALPFPKTIEDGSASLNEGPDLRA